MNDKFEKAEQLRRSNMPTVQTADISIEREHAFEQLLPKLEESLNQIGFLWRKDQTKFNIQKSKNFIGLYLSESADGNETWEQGGISVTLTAEGCVVSSLVPPKYEKVLTSDNYSDIEEAILNLWSQGKCTYTAYKY